MVAYHVRIEGFRLRQKPTNEKGLIMRPRFFPVGPCCCGGLWIFLGSLSYLDHYRCQDCGLEMSTDGVADLAEYEGPNPNETMQFCHPDE